MSHTSKKALARLAVLCLGTCVSALLATPILAATATWTPGTNDFNTAGNWSTAAVPGSTDNAAFGASSQTTVSIAGSASVNGFVFNAGAPAYIFNVTAPSANTTLTLAGTANDALTNNSANAPTFNITGTGGQAALNIQGGSSANAVITVNNNGALNFSNSASSGNGLITVNAGGTANYAGFGDGTSTRIVLAGGTLSASTATTHTFGSIEGSGTITSTSDLVVGGLNTDMLLSASVQAPLTSFFKKVGTGTLTLAGSNNYRDTRVEGGTLVLANTGTLGSGALYMSDGTSFISQRSTIVGVLFFDGGSIAAAPGQTVEFNQQITFSSAAMVFGSPSNSGTIVLSGSPATGVPGTIEIAGGTVRDNTVVDTFNPGALVYAAARMSSFTVDAGAIADFNDHSSRSSDPGINLRGAGQVLLGTSASSGLRFQSTDFSGAISGAGGITFLSNASAHILTGANTYTGGTTINSGATLQIGNGGTSGSIAGNISDNGVLIFNRSDTAMFAGAISGSGKLTQAGAGTLILTGASTYTGGTAINSGSLQIGNGGTSGAVVGNITDNANLIFNRSDTATFAGRIDGNGTITQAGTGTTILTGFSNQFSGTTTISSGTLQIGDGSAGAALPGNIINNSNLALNVFGPFSIFGVISGSGTVTQVGGTTTLAAANTYTGGTIVNGGTLQLGTGGSLAATGPLTVNNGTFSLNGQNQTVGAISGNGGFIALTTATLTTNSNTSSTFAGQFTGVNTSGSLVKAGTGTLTLTNSSIVNGVTIASGAIQLGGTTGALISDIVNNGALIFNRSNAMLFSNVISGSGTVAQTGSGTVTLAGTNTYTGATAISAGTLNVTGAIASSSVSVANGATLSGSGKVGATNIASGGTLKAGDSGTPGTLTIGGNLTMASGSNYVDFITPTATGLVSVSGTAAINGSAAANFAAGSYAVGQRFTLLTASGGLSGSFASLSTPGLSLAFKGRLSYDASNVYLNLDPNTLAPLLSNPAGNQSNVVKAIDTAVLAGAALPTGFQALYGLSGAALNSALDQLAGPIGPNIVNSAGQSFQAFLSLMGQGGDGGGGFAPGNAYGNAGAPHRAQLGAGEMRVWGAGYGGHVGLSADPVSGAASLSGTNAGLIGGMDMQVQDGLLLGATLGWGGQDFRSGNGTGTSEDVAIGIYGRHEDGPLYVSASLGYGWHHIKTLRTVTVSGTNVLQGIQDATDFGGRLETGWRLALDKAYAITPYAAFMGDSLESPGYSETAVSGASTFALSVAPHTDGLGRVEAGARLSRNYGLEDGTLAGDLQAAWAHQVNDVPLTQASFLGLSGANFVVAGVRPARDAALLGASLEMRERSGLFFGLKGETLLGKGTTTVEAMGDLGWRW